MAGYVKGDDLMLKCDICNGVVTAYKNQTDITLIKEYVTENDWRIIYDGARFTYLCPLCYAAYTDRNREKNINKLIDRLKEADARVASRKNGQQKTATPDEAARRKAELRTQGRKGCKATRINMAFTPDNHEYLKIMARASGKTITEFVNIVVEQHRMEHLMTFNQAKMIIKGAEREEF